MPGVASWQADGERLLVEMGGPATHLLRRVGELEVLRVSSPDQDLEDVFFAYYRDDEEVAR